MERGSATDGLAEYLAALERVGRYHVDRVLKQTEAEVTERVYLTGNADRGCPDGVPSERAGDGNLTCADASALRAGSGVSGAPGKPPSEDAGRGFPACGAASGRGPFIRKRFARGMGLGKAYQRLYDACRAGERFAHIPCIYECFADEEALVVVMELVDGPTLQAYVANSGAGLRTAAALFPGLCAAVDELRTCFDPPIVHRDLKPSNVIVCDGAPVLIDFGIARDYSAGAETDTVHFGTRAYAPPEQYGYGQTTVRSDVYALGMLLYFLLTGRDPSPGLAQRGFAGTGIGEPLLQVLRRATAFDPRQRYANARELGAAFAHALEGSSPRAGQPGASAPPGCDAATPSGHDGLTQPGPGVSPPKRDAAAPKRWRGLARNLVVLAAFLMLFIICISDIVTPGSSTVDYGFAGNIVVYGVSTPLLIGAGCFLLLDRRHLRERHAWAARVSPRRDKWIALGLVGVSLLAAAFCGLLKGVAGW